MTVSMTGLAHDEVPQATMITRIAQQVGGAFGTAILAVVLSTMMTADPTAAVDAFHAVFWIATAVALVALVASLVLPERDVEIPTPEEAEAAEASV